jgi:transcriptional regulator with XRE-family HTH domain
LSAGNKSGKIVERAGGGLKLNFNKEEFAAFLILAKGDRSINRFGNDAGVDPGYISRLLRGLVENAPGAMVIKKLADAAWNGVTIEDLLGAAGYIDIPGKNTDDHIDLSPEHRKWQRVIEEAARYNISPEDALDFITSLGKSMARIRKDDA